jgi:sterol desaturase/sphingolipid hydroxylase (fatty acid hydroxylase superfamily)
VRLGQVSELSLLIAYIAAESMLVSAKASYLVQLTTLIAFVVSCYVIVMRYPTPIAVSDRLRRDGNATAGVEVKGDAHAPCAVGLKADPDAPRHRGDGLFPTTDTAGPPSVEDFVQSNEATLRLAFFLGSFALMALWELLAPRRRLRMGRGVRWASNLGIVVIDTLLLRLVFPTAAVGVALAAEANGWGLLNLVHLPRGLAAVLSVLALDLAIYLQHVMFHAVPALWRLHRMHHADLDFDVTTGARFHPLEILLSMVIKLTVVAALGPPAAAVLAFEVVLNATSMFNHGNVRLPPAVDRWLRLVLVTPDMHRVHHSRVPAETNSNFGFNLPWWDRLLGTYRAQPAAGHEGMSIGLKGYDDPHHNTLPHMLVQPFVGDPGDYAINRRG